MKQRQLFFSHINRVINSRFYGIFKSSIVNCQVVKACKNLQSVPCVSLQHRWRSSKTKEIKLMQEKYCPLHTEAGNSPEILRANFYSVLLEGRCSPRHQAIFLCNIAFLLEWVAGCLHQAAHTQS
jgi:hypothetical protein